MAGFHIGVRGKAAGQIVRCAAREGACKLTGADGEPTPHFSSLADGEAFLAERETLARAASHPPSTAKRPQATKPQASTTEKSQPTQPTFTTAHSRH